MKSVIKTEVSTKGVVELKRDIVWNKLIAFGGTEKFVPNLIERVNLEGSGIGAVRNIYLKGGEVIVEKLNLIDSINFKMEFVILSTPMPIFEYVGIMKVNKISNDTCEVLFTSKYDIKPEKKEEIQSIIKGFQETLISNLDK